MSIISLSVSVAANSSSGNVLAGSVFEFIAQPSIVTVAITQAGAAASDITMDFQIGGESISSQANTPFVAPMPNFRDNLLLRAGGVNGERLFMNLNNTTAGALVAQVLIEIQPL